MAKSLIRKVQILFLLQLCTINVLTLVAGRSLSGGVTAPIRREVYDNGKIFDITHRVNPKLPSWGSKDGLGQYIWLVESMKNGSDSNGSEIKLSSHTGTHIDAPSHFYEEYYEAGYDIDTLDLEVLNGPALLVDVPRDSNITAEVLKSLNIPKGIRRVLFRTLNTERKLMFKKEFDSSYVGFMEDGAKWLVKNTDIKLVGLDYLSVAAYVDATPTHLVFLKSREIILVEGLKLDNIKAGLYNVHCLPLRLLGSDGSPARSEVMKSLNIPKGVRRVLFRTLNTDRKLMLKKEFDTSYVGFMEDGAKWLVDSTAIKFVGLDYLSVAAYVEAIPAHLVFLKSKEIILVEALKLDNIKAGLYNVHCLPLRLLGAEGSPARCILIS